MRPLGWLATICGAILFGVIEAKADAWIVAVFVTATVLSVILYMVAYVYCLINDREALRSETYSIQKLAIEKGLLGDSNVGMIHVEQMTESGKAIQVINKNALGGPE